MGTGAEDMSTTQQPEALAFCWATELAMTQQPVTLSVTEAREVSAGMQRLHTENTALQQGYAAARLEIESLQARIKTMAEEHADELMVAHLDGRSQAAQQPTPSVAAHKACKPDMLVNGGALKLALNVLRRAGKHEVADELEATAQPTPTPQADSVTAPVGGAAVPADWPTDAMIEAGRKVAATHGRLLGSGQSLWHVFREMFAAAPTPPAQTADSVLEDAARYRWLRQEHERVDPVCHLTWKRNLQRDSSEWVNTAVLDTAIDKARKQGENHD